MTVCTLSGTLSSYGAKWLWTKHVRKSIVYRAGGSLTRPVIPMLINTTLASFFLQESLPWNASLLYTLPVQHLCDLRWFDRDVDWCAFDLSVTVYPRTQSPVWICRGRIGARQFERCCSRCMERRPDQSTSATSLFFIQASGS